VNAPFRVDMDLRVALADLNDPQMARSVEGFVAAHPESTPFHRPVWLNAVARGRAMTRWR
jgi:hypothetical protein